MDAVGKLGLRVSWAETSGHHLSRKSGALRPLDRLGAEGIFSFAHSSTMIFNHLAKWRPRNLATVQRILEDAPGTLPVKLEKTHGGAFLSINRSTEGRFETLSVALRHDWLEEASGVPQLARAVRRFAECASGFGETPISEPLGRVNPI